MSDNLRAQLDDELLAQLAAALETHDPVPEDALLMAKAQFALGNADAELAKLVFDSLLHDAPVLMRDEAAVADARTLSFAAEAYAVDIELSAEDGLLLGQLTPARAVRVELETLHGPLETVADDLGRFQFPIRRGSLRLRIGAVDSVIVATPWIIW